MAPHNFVDWIRDLTYAPEWFYHLLTLFQAPSARSAKGQRSAESNDENEPSIRSKSDHASQSAQKAARSDLVERIVPIIREDLEPLKSRHPQPVIDSTPSNVAPSAGFGKGANATTTASSVVTPELRSNHERSSKVASTERSKVTEPTPAPTQDPVIADAHAEYRIGARNQSSVLQATIADDQNTPIQAAAIKIKSPPPPSYSAHLGRGKDPPPPPATINITVKRPGPADTPSSTQIKRQKENIPRFYFPRGRPVADSETTLLLDRVKAVFNALPNGRAKIADMPGIMTATELPLYWKRPLFSKCRGADTSKDSIAFQDFKDAWLRIARDSHDEASRFVRILAGDDKRNHLVFDDFKILLQDVVDTHPGLSFLREAAEFHSRYVQTVICRIFYSSSKPWSQRITTEQLRRSDLLKTIRMLQSVEDINQLTNYFSYEHFYVIYCKFWELDRDHDLLVSREDLLRHNDFAVSSRVVDRIFSGIVSINGKIDNGQLPYTDFVWFLLAEEGKRHPTSIDYWFRCLDVDGDGYLSFHELDYFYEETCQRLRSRGLDPIPFNDIICQQLDLIEPRHSNRISLGDLKRCHNASMFFDTFINVEKYLDMEQRDGVSASKFEPEEGMSDWDRYAAEEYELLVQEENAVNDDILDVQTDVESEGGPGL